MIPPPPLLTIISNLALARLPLIHLVAGDG